MSAKSFVKQESSMTLLPARKGDRTYGFFDQVAVQVCFGIAAWYFLAGAQTGLFLPAHQAIPTILLGNCLPLFLIGLVGIYSARYGMDSISASMGCFGSRGPLIIVVMFVAQLVVSASMPMLLFGQLAIKFSERLGLPDFLCTTFPGSYIWCMVALGLGIFIAYSGPTAMGWFSRLSAIFMMAIIVWLCYYLFTEYGFHYIYNAEPQGRIVIEGDEALSNRWNIASALETNFGLGFSWAFMFGMFTRLGKTESKAYQGCIWGWGIVSCLAIMFGAWVALGTGIYDPSDWILQASDDKILMAVVGLLFMAVANISSIAINTYPGAVAITSRFTKVPWLAAICIVGLPTLLLMNPAVYTKISTIYAIVGLLTSLFAGVVVTDVLFISKGRVSLREYYNRSKGFRFAKGFNPAGFISLAVGWITYLLILNPITWTSVTGLFPYTCAALPTFIVTGLTYLILMKCWIVRKYPITFVNDIKREEVE